MFINEEQWEKLQKYIFSLNWMEQFMGEDIRLQYQKMKNYVSELDRKLKKSSKIYVITNNAIVDDEIDYSIAGVATNKEDAKKIFNEAVRNVKIDIDFKNIHAINVTNKNEEPDERWHYIKKDNIFELYLEGEYNSNNFSVCIKEFDLPKNREKLKHQDREL